MKKIYIVVFVLVSHLLCYSCGDWLDVLPQSQITSEKVFDNEDGYYSALSGVYLKMADKNAYGNSMTVCQLEIMGQTISMAQASLIEPYYDQGDFNGFATYYYPLQTRFGNIETTITAIWKAAYNAIANDNLLLENLETQDAGLFEPGAKEVLLGEALALRAYLHFDMLRIFQPPYATEEGKTQKRIPYKEAYGMDFTPSASSDTILNRILVDLKRAETMMKDNDPISSGKTYRATYLSGDRKLKMNYYAVRALQARVYLWRGDYQEAYDAAMEVIGAADDMGVRFLTMDDLSTKDSQNDYVNRSCPMEYIFGLQVDEIGDYIDYYFRTSFSYFERFRLQSTRYPKFYSSTGDIRMLAWKKGSGSNMYLAKYGRATLEKDLALYPRPVVSMLKLGEMYLIASEAAAHAVSTGEALRLVTVLQSSRLGGVFTGTDKDAILDEILKEYRREMIGDGQVFYAYKRRNAPEIEKGYLASGVITMDVEKYTPDIPSAEYDGGRVY